MSVSPYQTLDMTFHNGDSIASLLDTLSIESIHTMLEKCDVSISPTSKNCSLILIDSSSTDNHQET